MTDIGESREALASKNKEMKHDMLPTALLVEQRAVGKMLLQFFQLFTPRVWQTLVIKLFGSLELKKESSKLGFSD